jgi:hypothetical protein
MAFLNCYCIKDYGLSLESNVFVVGSRIFSAKPGGHVKSASPQAHRCGGRTVIVCRLPIIGKIGRQMQPFSLAGGNFCRLERESRPAAF